MYLYIFWGRTGSTFTSGTATWPTGWTSVRTLTHASHGFLALHSLPRKSLPPSGELLTEMVRKGMMVNIPRQ